METPHLNEALAGLDRLPALPATAARAIALLGDGGANAAEVERLFRTDEGLATAVLRRANSAAFAPGAHRAFGLRDAIARLGNRALLRIALEHSAAAPLRDAGRSFGLERGSLWRGAVGGASIAESLAREHAGVDADIAFAATLVRDIGKLAIDALAGGERAASWAGAAPDRPFCDVERDRFGADHAVFGAALAERWSLPTPIIAAIRHHHRPDAVVDSLVDIVHCADCVARWAGLGIGDDGLFHPLSPRARAAIGLDRPRVESLASLAHEFVASCAIERESSPQRMSA